MCVSFGVLVLMSCSFWADISNTVSSGSNRKEMGDGCDITVGRWTFLFGRPFCFCWDWFVQSNILFFYRKVDKLHLLSHSNCNLSTFLWQSVQDNHRLFHWEYYHFGRRWNAEWYLSGKIYSFTFWVSYFVFLTTEIYVF